VVFKTNRWNFGTPLTKQKFSRFEECFRKYTKYIRENLILFPRRCDFHSSQSYVIKRPRKQEIFGKKYIFKSKFSYFIQNLGFADGFIWSPSWRLRFDIISSNFHRVFSFAKVFGRIMSTTSHGGYPRSRRSRWASFLCSRVVDKSRERGKGSGSGGIRIEKEKEITIRHLLR